ncbi:hypothetical protein C8R41DRAFT_871805 [Lentinula lateritia]|uniref:Uncharacterized protein n=1 Tax=Lentinula lateritia TaxID=40482 RepID=A0ABQ8V1W4_9AGAR|nr:hypothetical protein C8R41DRAFT_871805 [Lentinula lateritia]
MRLAAFFVASALGLFTFIYAAPLVAIDTVDELLSLHARNVTARGSPSPESPSPKSPSSSESPSSESKQRLIFSFPSPETVRYKHVHDGQTVPAAQEPKPTTDRNKQVVMNRINSFFPKEEYTRVFDPTHPYQNLGNGLISFRIDHDAPEKTHLLVTIYRELPENERGVTLTKYTFLEVKNGDPQLYPYPARCSPFTSLL